MKFAGSLWFGLLLNVLLPGLGHFYFRDYLFGIFVLLVWIIASVLFYVSFLVELPFLVKTVLLGRPLLFYLFTFFDLSQSFAKNLKVKPKSKPRVKPNSGTYAGIVLTVALVYQLFSPTAPGNFWIHNGPRVFELENNRLSPLYTRGTLMKLSSLAYSINIIGFDMPRFHHLPKRYDIVRCQLASGRITNAVVLGLLGEGIEVVEGRVIIDGRPEFAGWIGGLTFTGDVSAVLVGQFSILVAELSLGTIDKVYEIPLADVKGKVEKLFN